MIQAEDLTEPKRCPKCGSEMMIGYVEYPSSRTTDREAVGGTIAIPSPRIFPSSCATWTSKTPTIKEYWKCTECSYSETETHGGIE